ncbi:hypothetical protein KM868_10100 [Micrococcus luteus]|uniref:hypothetical protein n=1 Tax=Micrococcus luteus TaxID=1270 RepID=UPI00128DA4B9|nr:hypothetical protein [Micrococcus luteus]MBU8763848.1 hypothetical protein [Micrococcus luteus]MCV7495887.1 hypothetical protein [Micrococcus luteus]MPZ02741.1 hypothetical protein [Micrococcus luteus]
MKWIRGGGEGWDRAWVKAGAQRQFQLLDEDRVGRWWFDLATGHEVALVLDGGWRMLKNGRPYDARFRVFFYDGVGRVVELTEALLGTDGKAGRLDQEATGSGRYRNAERESVWLVEEALEVYENEGLVQVARQVREQEDAERLAEDGTGGFGLRREP